MPYEEVYFQRIKDENSKDIKHKKIPK